MNPRDAVHLISTQIPLGRTFVVQRSYKLTYKITWICLTGLPATWADGDWDGAPGGDSDNPPVSRNEFFNQLDILAAINAGIYRTEPYADVGPSRPPNLRCVLEGGRLGDNQTSTVYDISTGELSIDSGGNRLSSILIKSETGIFIGDRPPVLDGTFDVFNSNTIFKATIDSNFRDISFGNVLPAGMPMDLFHNALRVDGSLAVGRDLGNVDNVFLADLEVTVVEPGDSNGDGRFNQLDIVQVLQSNKYLTGEPASFEEGDWNRDGVFNQVDIVAALQTGTYLQGPAALTMAKDSNTQEPTTEELSDFWLSFF